MDLRELKTMLEAVTQGHFSEDAPKLAEYTPHDARNLEDLLREAGESFHEMLFRLIRERGLEDTEVYRRAGLDRRLFFKIRSNPAYHPGKSTVLALAVGLKLSIPETEQLLAAAEYAFSAGSRRDLIVRYFIGREVYDIDIINYGLSEFGEPLLGKEHQ